MDPEVEARIVEMRREHPGWGPRTIGHRLERRGCRSGAGPHVDLSVPGPPRADHARRLGKRKRSDYKRWERSRAMELWQMDIVGGVRLADGSEAKIVSGIDDHSRFCVSALVVARATARPMCDALGVGDAHAMGCPTQILTDNGKVFTGRFGPGTGEVLFDRICRENGIKHLLTAPRSPTTTGKVERWHKTLRREFLNGKVFASIDDAQAQLDAWVRALQPRAAPSVHRAWSRRSSGSGSPQTDRVDADRAAAPDPSAASGAGDDAAGQRERARSASPRVRYKAGVWLAGRDRRGRLRRRARAAPPPRCAHRHPRPPPPPRQADRRRCDAAASHRPSKRPVGDRRRR